jgi:hypothetical protein
MTRTIFLPHAVAAMIVTILSGLIYASVQQVYRTAANDPQIEKARDIAHRVSYKKPVAEFVNPDTVDLRQSLATFIQLYDNSGKLTASTGFIEKTAPIVPAGVLETARQKGEDDVTWQPVPEVRLASVIVYTGRRDGGYVLAGRSLLEVEKREANLQTMALLCWLLCMGIICAHAMLQGWLGRKGKAKG